jgi:hypothetical protein
MHRSLVLFLAFAAVNGGTVGSLAQSPSFTLAITPVRERVKSGSDVRVRIELKNTSEDDIGLTCVPCGGKDCPEIEGFRPIVKDSHGNEPPLTPWGRAVYGKPRPGEASLTLNAVGLCPLEPGNTYTAVLVVSGMYDMSAPGRYTIEIPYKSCPFGVPLDRGKKREDSPEVRPSTAVTVVP